MIDPKELRLGNFVLIGSLVWTPIEGVHSSQAFVCNGVGVNYIDIDPIPITPEWLERFGFLPYPFNYGWKHESQWLEIDSMGGYFQYPHGCAEIRYIHQLQNLFFALTGLELTIK